jgi:HTH-type transcriptional regulator/antitoxin HigA
LAEGWPIGGVALVPLVVCRFMSFLTPLNFIVPAKPYDRELHERTLAEIEKLMDKGDHRLPEEDAALDLMIRLLKDYEAEHHPLPDPSPQEMLVFLMEQRNLKQADLLPIFNSRGYVSDIVNAKRAISRAHARQLADFFKVSAELFT